MKNLQLILTLTVGFCLLAGCSAQMQRLIMSGATVQSSPQQEANWLNSVEDAFAQSQSTGKPILANFTGSDWCIFCKKLESEVFATPQFEAWAAERFVLLNVDFPRNTKLAAGIAQQNEEFKARYETHIGGYPTVLMLATDGSVIGKMGYVQGGPDAWIQQASAQSQ